MTETLAARLARVRAGIPPGVKLVAVSKSQPPEAIREAYAAGQRAFGENYVQEWREKAEALRDLGELEWHFVGGLQTNKVKYLAGRVALVHTVDREELGQEISRRFERKEATAQVLVEVNVGREAAKAGCDPDRVPDLVRSLRLLPRLSVEGLMCIPPEGLDPRPFFGALRELARGLGLRELSMGMSSDYPVAIECGATIVRVGTAIFGERRPRAEAG